MIFKGDLNGDGKITLTDLFILAHFFLRYVTLTEDQKISADIDNTGVIDEYDFYDIENHISGIEIIDEVVL